jgi:hypothetical protein
MLVTAPFTDVIVQIFVSIKFQLIRSLESMKSSSKT